VFVLNDPAAGFASRRYKEKKKREAEEAEAAAAVVGD
jgi:hypothetical protein